MKIESRPENLSDKMIRSALFTAFQIEGKLKWAKKYNKEFLKCFEKINEDRINNIGSFIEEDEVMEEEKEDEVMKLEIDLATVETFEGGLLKIIEEVQNQHDFMNELQVKKEKAR